MDPNPKNEVVPEGPPRLPFTRHKTGSDWCSSLGRVTPREPQWLKAGTAGLEVPRCTWSLWGPSPRPWPHACALTPVRGVGGAAASWGRAATKRALRPVTSPPVFTPSPGCRCGLLWARVGPRGLRPGQAPRPPLLRLEGLFPSCAAMTYHFLKAVACSDLSLLR